MIDRHFLDNTKSFFVDIIHCENHTSSFYPSCDIHQVNLKLTCFTFISHRMDIYKNVFQYVQWLDAGFIGTCFALLLSVI